MRSSSTDIHTLSLSSEDEPVGYELLMILSSESLSSNVNSLEDDVCDDRRLYFRGGRITFAEVTVMIVTNVFLQHTCQHLCVNTCVKQVDIEPLSRSVTV